MPILLSLLYCLLNLPVQYYAKTSCAHLRFIFFFKFFFGNGDEVQKAKCLQMHLVMYFFHN
jgi:hypothetical protein